MTLYLTLNIPSIFMVAIGYRHYELNYIGQGYIVFAEILTKIAFGFVLMPLVPTDALGWEGCRGLGPALGVALGSWRA